MRWGEIARIIPPQPLRTPLGTPLGVAGTAWRGAAPGAEGGANGATSGRGAARGGWGGREGCCALGRRVAQTAQPAGREWCCALGWRVAQTAQPPVGAPLGVAGAAWSGAAPWGGGWRKQHNPPPRALPATARRGEKIAKPPHQPPADGQKTSMSDTNYASPASGEKPARRSCDTGATEENEHMNTNVATKLNAVVWAGAQSSDPPRWAWLPLRRRARLSRRNPPVASSGEKSARRS